MKLAAMPEEKEILAFLFTRNCAYGGRFNGVILNRFYSLLVTSVDFYIFPDVNILAHQLTLLQW